MNPKRKAHPVVPLMALGLLLALLTLLAPWTGAPPARAQGGTWEEITTTPALAPRYGAAMFAFGGNAYL